MPDLHTSRFKIEVGGAPLPDAVDHSMLSGYIDTSTNLPDLFVLVFRDENRSVIDDGRFTIGAKVTVKVDGGNDPGGTKLIDGEITALEAQVDEGMGPLTIVRGLDPSHRLFRGRFTKNYTDVSFADVAKEVADRAGLEVGQIDPTDPRMDHISQANVTDWEFLKGLAAEVGYEMGVVDGKFNFRQPPESTTAPSEGALSSDDPLQLVIGNNVRHLRSTVTAADQVSSVEVRGWDVDNKQALSSVKDPTARTLDIGTDPGQLAQPFGTSSLVAVDIPYGSQPEVDAAADALAEAVGSTFGELDGVLVGTPTLKAGCAVSVGLLKAPFDGKYTVTSARHQYDPEQGYTTSFVVSGSRDRSLQGMIAGSSAGSGGGGSARIPGVVTATVSDLKDPDQKGRVKVQYPWMSDSYTSDWARVVQLGAGDGRGMALLPEVGDEVLVAFENGDVRRPFIIGGLYNGKDKPHSSVTDGDWVDANSGDVNKRSFVSRTAHRLEMVDKSGTETVTLTTGDDKYKLVLDQAGTKITVNSDGSVEIQAKNDIKISSDSGNVEISGMQVKITGQQSLTLDGGPQTKVTGSVIQLN